MFCSLSLIALGAAEGALANDSSAELATGGLVLKKSADIEMRSEDLFISTNEIRVFIPCLALHSGLALSP
jgi:hypothetical protein